MTGYRPGQIVLVPFPFTDLRTIKKRPALVLASISSRSFPSLVIAAMITSEHETEVLVGDYVLTRWQEAGLLYPSKVRLAKLVSLEQQLVVKELGKLHIEDQAGVAQQVKKIFAAWD